MATAGHISIFEGLKRHPLSHVYPVVDPEHVWGSAKHPIKNVSHMALSAALVPPSLPPPHPHLGSTTAITQKVNTRNHSNLYRHI